MIYRFCLALVLMIGLFPFVSTLSLKLLQPDTHFALDFETWRVGLIPMAVGWVVFLSPVIIPGVGRYYLPWVGRVTGLTHVADTLRSWRSRTTSTLSRTAQQARALLGGFRRRPSVSTPVSDAASRWSTRIPGVSPSQLGAVAPAAESSVPAPAGAADTAPESASPFRSRLKHLGERLSNLSTDPQANLESARTRLRSFRDRVTAHAHGSGLVPSELNAYTLETMAHLKQIARLAARALELPAEDAKFVDAVCSAIPQPLLPGEDDHPAPEAFLYAEDRRPELISRAAECRVLLTEEDFDQAASGDLERGLKVALSILQVADYRRRRAIERAAADPLLVLSQHNPAEPLED